MATVLAAQAVAISSAAVVAFLTVLIVARLIYMRLRAARARSVLARANVFRVSEKFTGKLPVAPRRVTVIEKPATGEPGIHMRSMIVKDCEDPIDLSSSPGSVDALADMPSGKFFDSERNVISQEKFYWEEDVERLSLHKDVLEDRWVAYPELVQDQLFDVFHRFLRLSEETRDRVRQASIDGVAIKDVAPSSYKLILRSDEDAAVLQNPREGRLKWLEINVATMTQKNMTTGFERRVFASPGGRTVRLSWHWEEDHLRMIKWARKRLGDENWIVYPTSLQKRLSTLFLRRLGDTSVPSKVYVDSDMDVCSELDHTYAIDTAEMTQTKRDTGTTRRVSLRIEVIGEAKRHTKGFDDEATEPRLGAMPSNIPRSEMLELEVGAAVCVVARHDDDDSWAYGAEVGTDRVGWFPMVCLEEMTLEVLQDAGGPSFEEFELFVPPAEWSFQDVDHRGPVLMSAGQRETEEVSRWFKDTSVNVLAVERVENVAIWRLYAAKLLYILRQRNAAVVSGGPFERFPVFQGTTIGTMATVVELGFMSRGRNPNVSDLGEVRFATSASTLLEVDSPAYGIPDAQGVRRMFVCKTIVGKTVQAPLAAPPWRFADRIHDSVVDHLDRPTLILAAEQQQCYPSYLVTYKPTSLSAQRRLAEAA